MGALRPFVLKEEKTPNVHDKERSLTREVSQQIEAGIPGIEVLALEMSGPDRFTVFVDHAGGVDHALCARVTDVLRDYLREYTVEVSSPGIERPLRTPEHFRRAVGRNVNLRTRDQIDGRARFRGEVLDAGDRTLRLAADGTEFDIPYDTIVRGNLIYEG